MFARAKPKESSSPRKTTPPSGSAGSGASGGSGSQMNSEQFASYLRDLRNNRVTRPGGARPSVDSRHTTGRLSFGSSATTRSSAGSPPPLSEDSAPTSQSTGRPNGARDFSARPSLTGSVVSRYTTTSIKGRDYIPKRPGSPLKPGEVVPTSTYIERGQRWMEKEEAVSLRQAMEDKDQMEHHTSSDEDPLYNAALDEASELVWQHQHGVKPPEPGTPYRYKQHLRKDSYNHARTASVGRYGDEIEPTGLARDRTSRSFSGSSTSSDGFGTSRSRLSYRSSHRKSPDLSAEAAAGSTRKSAKSYNGLSDSSQGSQSGRRRSSAKRNITGEIEQKPFSSDQIWEEPEDSTPKKPASPDKPSTTLPLRNRPKNPFQRVSFAPERERPGSPSYFPPQPSSPIKLNRFEIQRNPPSQSRNPQYTSNSRPVTPVAREDVPKKHGMEIRGDDIRQATSMKLSDRSPKLPTPTAVSDRAGRPIVSFDKNWKAPEEVADEKPDFRKGASLGAFRGRQDHQHQTPSIPTIAVSETRQSPASSPTRGPPPPSIQVDAPAPPSRGPAIPTIAISDDAPSIPTIVLPGGDNDNDNDGPSIPVIVTPDDNSSSSKPSPRPLPTPQKGAPKVRPGGRPRGHWTPTTPSQIGNRATARCHECNNPIEGRFVALAGTNERFHPQCFSCYICGTSLEALEISPEPDLNRTARLERIQRRAAGERLEEKPGETMAEDGDERLRFYCHLDWHELFAPRCKHCTTPILGEHVVALGEHWHYGHFFCAECGDPFTQGMTHIEKDGYAWCVNCQTKRTERRAPKCKKCCKAVIGQYIRALGGEWHDECFRCATCQGGFDDGQVFPREEGGVYSVLCTKCRERELKR